MAGTLLSAVALFSTALPQDLGRLVLTLLLVVMAVGVGGTAPGHGQDHREAAVAVAALAEVALPVDSVRRLAGLRRLVSAAIADATAASGRGGVAAPARRGVLPVNTHGHLTDGSEAVRPAAGTAGTLLLVTAGRTHPW